MLSMHRECRFKKPECINANNKMGGAGSGRQLGGQQHAAEGRPGWRGVIRTVDADGDSLGRVDGGDRWGSP